MKTKMIYLYTGDNDYAIAEKVQAVRAAFAAKNGELAVEKMDGEELDGSELVSRMVNIDMFAPQKLLLIYGAGKRPTAWQKIADNLPRVPDSTDVVLVEAKPDGRLNATKTIKKLAKTTEFKRLKPWEVVAWVKQELQRSGIEAQAGAVDELVLYCGADQWRIAGEIKKLAGLGKVLTVELVRRYVEPEVSADAFLVLELAFKRQKTAMNRELGKLRAKESPDKFLGLLASQVFALAAAKHAGTRSGAEVARAVGVHPFVMQKMIGLARDLSTDKLKQLAQDLAELDAKLKLGVDGWGLITVFLNKI